MREIYREHEIVMRNEDPRCAIIFERMTGMELPTKITALPEEADQACMRRARRLIDLYLEAPVHG